MSVKKFAKLDEGCVACGYCLELCPREAIAIHKGMYAVIDQVRCNGCGQCARGCSAGSIVMTVTDEV